jgi:transketolase
MAAIAAGLATTGKIAFIASYATFSPGKNWETLRTTAVYNKVPVKIAGHHSGIATGPDGPTHQATEDIATTRVLPDLDVVVPAIVWRRERRPSQSVRPRSGIHSLHPGSHARHNDGTHTV